MNWLLLLWVDHSRLLIVNHGRLAIVDDLLAMHHCSTCLIVAVDWLADDLTLWLTLLLHNDHIGGVLV